MKLTTRHRVWHRRQIVDVCHPHHMVLPQLSSLVEEEGYKSIITPTIINIVIIIGFKSV